MADALTKVSFHRYPMEVADAVDPNSTSKDNVLLHLSAAVLSLCLPYSTSVFVLSYQNDYNLGIGMTMLSPKTPSTVRKWLERNFERGWDDDISKAAVEKHLAMLGHVRLALPRWRFWSELSKDFKESFGKDSCRNPSGGCRVGSFWHRVFRSQFDAEQ